MRLGLSTYSFTWAVGVPGHMPGHPMSVSGLIHEAVRSGVSCVQIGDNLPLHRFNSSELQRLSDFADSNNVNIEVGTRGLQPENVIEYIGIAAKFRSPILRIVIDAPGFEPTLKEVISILTKIKPVLNQNNIKLAVENHDRFTSSEFAEMIVNTDPELIGICLDSVNSIGAAEGLHEVVGNLAPFTINLHIKDFVIKRVWHKMGFVVEGAPAGQGRLNIGWLKNEIDKYGRCQSAILELWTPPEDNIDATIAKEKKWVGESLSFLKTVF